MVEKSEINIDLALEYCKTELGLNAQEFLQSSPNLFFSHIYSKNDKNDLTRYDYVEQIRLFNNLKPKS